MFNNILQSNAATYTGVSHHTCSSNQRGFIVEQYFSTRLYTKIRQEYKILLFPILICLIKAQSSAQLKNIAGLSGYNSSSGKWYVFSRCRMIEPIFFETTITAALYQDIDMHLFLNCNLKNVTDGFDKITFYAKQGQRNVKFLGNYFK